MIRISLPYMYDISASLEPLSRFKAGKYNDLFMIVFTARTSLEGLLNESVFSPYLRTSYESANTLLKSLKNASRDTDFNREITSYEAGNIVYAYNQFKAVFTAEMSSIATYLVTQKAAFDTISILDRGETLFPSDLLQKVPEAAFDVREAGKCLGFEIPTAAGFHIMRATECVLRKYYHQVTGKVAPPKTRNIMVYVNTMEQKKCGDAKVLSSIKQISNLHRNPLMHPEDILTVEDAIGLLGIAASAISAMLNHLPFVALTTTKPMQITTMQSNY